MCDFICGEGGGKFLYLILLSLGSYLHDDFVFPEHDFLVSDGWEGQEAGIKMET